MDRRVCHLTAKPVVPASIPASAIIGVHSSASRFTSLWKRVLYMITSWDNNRRKKRFAATLAFLYAVQLTLLSYSIITLWNSSG